MGCFLTLTQSRPSQLNSYGSQGTGEKIQHSIIMGPKKIIQKGVQGTNMDPHDGQPWSMRNDFFFELNVSENGRSWDAMTGN